jgi:hypothetical protein
VRAFDRPCEADTEQISNPRRTALECLAGLMRGHRFTVHVKDWHLTVSLNGGRPVGVWCQSRADDGTRLWFTWSGGISIIAAENPTDAVVEVRQVTRRMVSA